MKELHDHKRGKKKEEKQKLEDELAEPPSSEDKIDIKKKVFFLYILIHNKRCP